MSWVELKGVGHFTPQLPPQLSSAQLSSAQLLSLGTPKFAFKRRYSDPSWTELGLSCKLEFDLYLQQHQEGSNLGTWAFVIVYANCCVLSCMRSNLISTQTDKMVNIFAQYPETQDKLLKHKCKIQFIKQTLNGNYKTMGNIQTLVLRKQGYLVF